MTREQALDKAVRRIWLPLREHMSPFNPLCFAAGWGQMPGLVDCIRSAFHRIMAEAAE